MSRPTFPRARSQERRPGWVLYVVGIGLLACILFNATTDLQATLAITIGVVLCAYPTVRYLQLRESGIPLVPVICAIYAFYFVLPAMTGDSTYPRFAGLPHSLYVNAVYVADLGVGLMLVGYYCALRIITPMERAVLHVTLDEKRIPSMVLWLGSLGILITVAGSAIHSISGLDIVLSFISQLPLLTIATLFYLQLQGKLSNRFIAVLWIAIIPAWFAIDIGSSLIYPFFRDGFVFFMIYLYVKKEIAWRAILPGLLVAFVLLGAKAQFRSQLATRGGYGNRVASGVAYVSLALQTSSSIFSPDGASKVLHSTVERLDNRGLLADIIHQTPGRVPYWEGTSYAQSFFKFVPRFIWPDKPSEDVGQTFAHRYTVIDSFDTKTSWNLPWLVEMYANFGMIAVVIGMTLSGLLLSALQRLMEPDNPSTWSFACAVLIYSGIFRVDSNFSLVFGGALYSWVLLWLLSRVLSRRGVHSHPQRRTHWRLGVARTRARPAARDAPSRRVVEGVRRG